MGGKAIFDATRRMEDNLAFARDKEGELGRLGRVIRERTRENESLGAVLVGAAEAEEVEEVEEAEAGDLEREDKGLSAEIARMCNEANGLKNDFREAWESMHNFRANVEKLGASLSRGG